MPLWFARGTGRFVWEAKIRSERVKEQSRRLGDTNVRVWAFYFAAGWDFPFCVWYTFPLGGSGNLFLSGRRGGRFA